MNTSTFSNGHRVVDGELEPAEQNEIVVINHPHVPINDWYGSDGTLVSRANPDYPESDETVITVYKSDMEEKYDTVYTGGIALQLRDVHRQDFKTYSFPASRLNSVAEPEPLTVPVEKIVPSPYHTRSFSIEEHGGLIDRIENLGHVFGKVIARPRQNSPFFELLNGHKRVWAATVAEDISTVDIHVHPATDLWAARLFVRYHLQHPDTDGSAYTGDLRERSIQRLEEELGQQANQVFDTNPNLEWETAANPPPLSPASNDSQTKTS